MEVQRLTTRATHTSCGGRRVRSSRIVVCRRLAQAMGWLWRNPLRGKGKAGRPDALLFGILPQGV